MLVKALMLGDVSGEPGLKALESRLPALIKAENANFVVVNGENAADGFGMTESDMKRILAAGADVITSGNHIWEKRDFWPCLDREDRILRPANYPEGCVGHGWIMIKKAGIQWVVINLQGREQMTPLDNPFTCFDQIYNNLTNMAQVKEPAEEMGGVSSADEVSGRNSLLKSASSPAGGVCVANSIPKSTELILVDFHAETTREKEALGLYLDGRASLVAGTHTHIQTADEKILPSGTGYITDLGLSGVQGAVIGMDTRVCLDRARTQVLYRMSCAQPEPGNPARLQGIAAEIDSETGKTRSIKRI
jgi:calcineurin-like phosphoesterase